MNRYRIYFLPLLMVVVIGLSSCERTYLHEAEHTPTAVFEYLWAKVDQQYALFDAKGVDWDSVYSVYAPKVSDDMRDDSLFAILASMMNSLHDGHANLWNSIDASRSEETFHNTYEQRNFDLQTVMVNYLRADYHAAGGLAYNTLRNGAVIYIRYSSFSNAALTSVLSRIISRYPEAKGIILDIRQNGGGSIENIWNILNIMPAYHDLLYTTQIKSGPKHDQFSDIEKVYSPYSNGEYDPYMKPVVVLIDRGSYSASSYFALCCKAYENITLLGDTTGGGLGMPNGGELPNGWIYRFPVTRTIAPDGKNYENGVPPDIVAKLDRDSVLVGVDNIIEQASDYITQ